MELLKKRDLFCTSSFVNGQWVGAVDGSTLAVENPATGVKLGTVPSLGLSEVRGVIDAASEAFFKWRSLSVKERGVYLMRWHDLIDAHKEDLARILTLEQGKPLAEAAGEIGAGLPYIPWYIEEARRAYGHVIPASRKGIRPITHQVPVGVVCAITPWNFPSSMILRKIAPALAAGCTAIVKPASATPYSALALAKLAEEAGFPNGIFNVITGNATLIGDEVASNSKIKKISFTGSTEVGKTIMRNSAVSMKRLSMELGGNAPFIIFDDADLDVAVNCAMASKFRNTGQTCICANRFIVQKGIAAQFTDAFVAKVKGLVIGNGLETGTTVGPMINKAAIENTTRLIVDAKAKGAQILLGGNALNELFFEPTVLAGMTKEMGVYQEEIFGPIAPIMTFETETEAIKLANDTPYGLAAYVMTSNMGRSWRVPEALEYGMVGVNDIILAMAEVPFGGVKESGMGREGGQEGIKDYMETRYVLMGDIDV